MLYLLSGPRRFSKKLQAGFNGRIVLETIDFDSIGELIPAVVLDKLYHYGFKRDAMHGVLGLLGVHAWAFILEAIAFYKKFQAGNSYETLVPAILTIPFVCNSSSND